jgi:hypothetical protein
MVLAAAALLVLSISKLPSPPQHHSSPPGALLDTAATPGTPARATSTTHAVARARGGSLVSLPLVQPLQRRSTQCRLHQAVRGPASTSLGLAPSACGPARESSTPSSVPAPRPQLPAPAPQPQAFVAGAQEQWTAPPIYYYPMTGMPSWDTQGLASSFNKMSLTLS